MTLADWLHTSGTTQTALAARLGVSPSTISRLARGETHPEPILVAAIARETGGLVMPNDLFPEAMASASACKPEAA